MSTTGGEQGGGMTPVGMAAVLRLAPSESISREALEDAAMMVEEALAKISDGGSATANFADGFIEIDLLLDGRTVGELHEQLARVITDLETQCALDITRRVSLPSGADLVRPALVVRSTATQVAEPQHLVPA